MMKLPLCLKLVASGAIAFGAITTFNQPASACPSEAADSTGTCPYPQPQMGMNPPVYVVPVTPIAYPPAPEMDCPYGSGAFCGQATVAAPMPVGCQTGTASCYPTAIAAPRDSFFCGKDQYGNPATYMATKTGAFPVVKWVSHHFAGSGYDPLTRCQDVSSRFDTYYRTGKLNYVTTGIINRHPAVCIATEIGGPCTGLLFTLKPNENASRVIQQLFDVRARASGSLYENEVRQYIDFRRYIESVKAAGAE